MFNGWSGRLKKETHHDYCECALEEVKSKQTINIKISFRWKGRHKVSYTWAGGCENGKMNIEEEYRQIDQGGKMGMQGERKGRCLEYKWLPAAGALSAICW